MFRLSRQALNDSNDINKKQNREKKDSEIGCEWETSVEMIRWNCSHACHCAEAFAAFCFANETQKINKFSKFRLCVRRCGVPCVVLWCVAYINRIYVWMTSCSHGTQKPQQQQQLSATESICDTDTDMYAAWMRIWSLNPRYHRRMIGLITRLLTCPTP